MNDKNVGTLTFNDPLRKFVFQENTLKRLTTKYDLDVAVIGDTEKFLQVAVSKAGEMNKKERFAVFRVAYDKIKAIDLRDYVSRLIAVFDHNLAKGKKTSFFAENYSTRIKEVSKEVFEKIGKNIK